MAANIFQSGGGGNWGNIASWSLGVIPTAADGHIVTFDATSPNCTVDTTSRACNNIDFTGYTNTITFNNNVICSGNIVLSTTMNTAGLFGLGIAANGSITTNTKVWDRLFYFIAGTYTATLTDDFHTTNDVYFSAISANGSITINGFKIYAGASVYSNCQVTSGATVLELNGTGNLVSAANRVCGLQLIINTAGTITLDTVQLLRYYGNWAHIAGTVVSTNSTVIFPNPNTVDLSGGMSFYNVNFQAYFGTHTLLSNVTVTNILTLSQTNGTTTINGFTISTKSITIAATSGRCNGTTNFIVNTTGGTWVSSGGSLLNNLTIAAGASITITSIVAYGTGTLTVDPTATVITGSNAVILDTGVKLNIGNTTQWYTFFPRGASTSITLLSDIYCDFLNVTFNGITFIGAYNIYCKNLVGTGINTVVSTTGTKLVLNPDTTGTWSLPGPIRCDVDINCTGTLTISGAVGLFNTNGATASKTFRRVAGTVITTGSTFNINGNWILDTNIINFNIFNIIGVASNQTFQLDSLLQGDTIQHTGPMDNRFTGAFGFTFNNMFSTFNTLASPIWIYQIGNTYTINNSLVLTGQSASNVRFFSSSTGTKAFFNLNPAATQNLTRVNATDIDSSGGQTIRTTPGSVLTRTINWAYKASSNFFLFFQ